MFLGFEEVSKDTVLLVGKQGSGIDKAGFAEEGVGTMAKRKNLRR